MLIRTLVLGGATSAASGNYHSDVDLKPILKPTEQGSYPAAIERLHEQLDYDPDNPAILSLLGFSQRKLRKFEGAPTLNQCALRGEPEHKGANEYLGELYLETKHFDRAVQQLEILDDLCGFGRKEYSKLKQAIDSYQQTASNS